MPRLREIQDDMRRLRELRQARATVQGTALAKVQPVFSWAIAPAGRHEAWSALAKVIATALPPAEMKTRVLAKIQARIDAIVNKYPGVTLEEG
jgi:hypothetical protein